MVLSLETLLLLLIAAMLKFAFDCLVKIIFKDSKQITSKQVPSWLGTFCLYPCAHWWLVDSVRLTPCGRAVYGRYIPKRKQPEGGSAGQPAGMQADSEWGGDVTI